MTSRQPTTVSSHLARITAAVAITAACGAMLACANNTHHSTWINPRPLAADLPTFKPPTLEQLAQSTSTISPPQPTGKLTLANAIALTLLHNPNLKSFAYQIRAREAAAIQAGLRPNPTLGYAIENYDPSNEGDFLKRQTIRISQIIELGDKRQKRINLANVNTRLAAWNYEAARLNLVALVARRHIAVVAAQQRLTLAGQNHILAKQVFDIAQQRAKAGVISNAQKDKAVVQLSLQTISLQNATHDLTAKRHALASLWNATSPSFTTAVANLNAPSKNPTLDQLVTASNQNPRIARWADELKQRSRAIDLARANAIPNLTLGGGLRYFPDADEFAALLEFSAPLTIFDRNQGNILAARYHFANAYAQQQNARADMKTLLTRAHADLASAAFAWKTLNTQTLTAATSAFNAAKDAFQKGKTDYLVVLDAERTLNTVQSQLISAREKYHQAVADIEALTATPFSKLQNPTAAPK